MSGRGLSTAEGILKTRMSARQRAIYWWLHDQWPDDLYSLARFHFARKVEEYFKAMQMPKDHPRLIGTNHLESRRSAAEVAAEGFGLPLPTPDQIRDIIAEYSEV